MGRLIGLSDRAMHRFLLRTALSGAHLFAWVFIFQYYYIETRSVAGAFISLALTYALTQVLVILLTPLSARRVRHGFKRGVIYALLSLAASFALLAAAFSGYLGNIGWGIGLFACFAGLYRALYWVPYEVATQSERGSKREWVEIFIALAPLCAGFYLTTGGLSPVILLYAASAVALLSILPILNMRDTHESFVWTYRQSFHELFALEYRSVLWSSFFGGIEAAALLLLWPVVVFTLLDWSYALLGVVMSLTFILTIISKKIFDGAIRTVPEHIQPVVAASGWFMRLGVGGFIGAVLVDTYFHTASRSASRGIDINSFEQTADNHTFVDEFTALKEMGMSIGRIALCLLAVVLVSLFALPHALAIAFILAACAAGLSVYFSLKHSRRY